MNRLNLFSGLTGAAIGLAVLGMSTPVPAQAPPLYRVIDLGTLDPSAASIAYGINNRGEVVGSTGTANLGFGADHAFVWDATNGMRLLPELSSSLSSSASAINDSGQIVGTTAVGGYATSASRAPVWTPNGNGTYSVRALNSQRETETPADLARDINNSGQIIGDSNNANFVDKQAVWNAADGSVQTVTSLFSGNVGSSTIDINNQGQLLFNSSKVGDLNDPAADLLSSGLSGGLEMNDSGLVVGFFSVNRSGVNVQVPGMAQAGDNTSATLLGVPDPSSDTGRASLINNNGEIIGAVNDKTTYWNAADPAQSYKLFDFLDPGAGLTVTAGVGEINYFSVTDINDLGQIVGYGLVNGNRHAILLDPLPTGGADKLVNGDADASILGGSGHGVSAHVSGAGDGLFIGSLLNSLADLLDVGQWNSNGTLTNIGQNAVDRKNFNFIEGWDLEFTGTHSGSIDLAFTLNPGTFPGNGQLYHFTNGAWELVDGSYDSNTHTFTASVNSLSPFAFGTPLAPSAVPEPSSLALLGIGAVGLLGWRRRREGRA